MNINLVEGESSGESSNTVYSKGATKTSTIGQPIRESYKDYRGEIEDFKPRGKRLPLEQVDKKLLLDEGKILNLTAHDPQKWPTILDMWSQKVCREWESLNVQSQAPQMYSYLEKFLGETVRAMWEAYKGNFPDDFNMDLALGANPYNFVNKIQLLILGQQPNVGIGKQQEEAMRKLEQLQIRQWNYIKPFLQDFIYYSSLAGCYYDRTIGEKLFLKLPAPLGGIIHKKYLEYEKTVPPALNNMTIKVKFIVDQLVEECTKIQIGRQLKGGNSFCRNIYTPQHYGSTDRRPRKIYKKYRSDYDEKDDRYAKKKKYYLRRSKARKPYLDKDKHVRKYDKKRDYKNSNDEQIFLGQQPNPNQTLTKP